LPANTITYPDLGLIPTTAYSYRIRAVNADGASGYSNTVMTTTLPQAPADPTQLKVTVIDRTRLKLDWTDNANNESEYHVERQDPGGPFVDLTPPLPADTTSFTVMGLMPKTRYNYRMRAFNVAGFSG